MFFKEDCMKFLTACLSILLLILAIVGFAHAGQSSSIPKPLYAVTYGAGTFVGGSDNTTSPQPLQITTTTLTTAKLGSGVVTSSPAGISCGNACSATFQSGTYVTLNSTATLGYYFTGWSGGGCTGNSPCTVKLTANSSIAATFNPAGYPFIDVIPGSWAEPYINAIYYASITNGYGGTNEFKPDYEITREQMAAFIVRAKTGEPADDYCSSGSPFADVSVTSWSCKYIKKLYELGLTTGYGGTNDFMPSLIVTREQMATVVVRALEGEPPSGYCDSGIPFADVSVTSWSCKYIKKLYELGITTGYGGTNLFMPELDVTRAQMATFIARAFLEENSTSASAPTFAAKVTLDVSGGSPPSSSIVYSAIDGDSNLISSSNSSGESPQESESSTTSTLSPYQWRKTGFLETIQIFNLVIDPTNPQVVYAGTMENGVYKSTDGGINWVLASKGIPDNNTVNTLVIDPTNPQVVYAGTMENGVYKSTDGGINWVLASKGLPARTQILTLSMDSTNSNVIYTGTDSGILKTIDNGKNWTSISTAVPYVSALVIDPKNPQAIYAGTWYNGLLKSTDGGRNWISVLTEIPCIPALAIDPIDSQVIYAGTMENSVYRSTDGGINWVLASAGLPDNSTVHVLVIDSTNPQVVYAGTFGIYTTKGNGQ
jgi:photosystem II stability/assembly factor-like uncharacterized protein